MRLALGRSLALSLEFLLGADILRTAVEPSGDEIPRLAAIAAIRTALNYFLRREIADEAKREASPPGLASSYLIAPCGLHAWTESRRPVTAVVGDLSSWS